MDHNSPDGAPSSAVAVGKPASHALYERQCFFFFYGTINKIPLKKEHHLYL